MTVPLVSRAGEMFGPFVLGDVVGFGGMGVVYAATRIETGELLAVKLMTPELSASEDFRQRFLDEAAVGPIIDHPNVVPIYGSGVTDGELYIAMKLIEGRNLKEVLKAGGPLEPQRTLRILHQVASAIDAAHESGIVHRDIKPQNILLATDPSGHDLAYVSDFGLVKPMSSETSASRTGQIFGSLPYMSPEQIEGMETDGRTDVYALGCVLFEVLTGTPPFERPNEVAVAWAHVHEDPPIPSTVRKELPGGIDAVLVRAMSKHPDDRYLTCGEFVEAFEEGLGRQRSRVSRAMRPLVARTPRPKTEREIWAPNFFPELSRIRRLERKLDWTRAAAAVAVFSLAILGTTQMLHPRGISGAASDVGGFVEDAAGGVVELVTGDSPRLEINDEGQVVNTATGKVLGSAEELGLTQNGLDTDANAAGGSTTTAGRTTTSRGAGEPALSGGDSTGVTDDVIRIGIHAPLTGASPVPSDSIEKAKDLYFRWMADQGQSMFGRKFEVILRNDKYNPSTAVSVCKEMVEKDKVFILAGLAGTDQMQACARYAASVGVPYLGTGITELILNQLPNYFAITATHNDQGPMLADYLVSDLGGMDEKNGVLTFDTPNFENARRGFRKGMKRQGATIHYERTVSQGAGTPEARTVVQEMQSEGIENVYVLTPPTWWIQVLKQADLQRYNPQWIGVGISMTFDSVAAASCGGGNSIEGAKFFSPFPAWIDSQRFDPDFRKAVARFLPEEGGGDDFMWLMWSGSTMIWEIFERLGENLTREGFIYKTERMRGLKNGITPPLNFSPDDHFGANVVHVSEARCSDRRWHTIESFVSSF